MVASTERSFLKLKYFCGLFMVNNNLRLMDEIDLNDISDV
jgi:hypothetical protein